MQCLRAVETPAIGSTASVPTVERFYDQPAGDILEYAVTTRPISDSVSVGIVSQISVPGVFLSKIDGRVRWGVAR